MDKKIYGLLRNNKWVAVLLLYSIAVSVVSVWAIQREKGREAKQKYEFTAIQFIIGHLADFQPEIESWGYEVFILPQTEEEPAFPPQKRYDWNRCQYPVLVLAGADGGMYFFYYGFDQYIRDASYPGTMDLTRSHETVDVLKEVKLSLVKNNIFQAPYVENTSQIDTRPYYDVEVEIYVEGLSLEDGRPLAVYGDGHYRTNYCSNNFVDCMYFSGLDPSTTNTHADYRIKQEYSAKQLLAFYRQGLGLQQQLTGLYEGARPGNQAPQTP